MRSPRPSEVDVEALAKALYEQIEWSGCEGAAWHRTGSGIRAHWTQAAERLLASDWLAARDAEHEREVAEAEVRGQMRHITAEVARGDQSLGEKEDLIADLRARLSHVGAERDSWRARAATNRDGWRQMLARAEAAERALADLRGEIKALADEWEVIGFGGVAVDLRALLSRDDAADAGGAK